MCCIFTFVGWIFDLLQRCWTFAMSAIIFSAIACTLLTASASGVALGYNYSMAEFIQLRETNVSVYLKRGVFDDEVADEMNFRRKEGGAPDSEGSSPDEYAGRSGNSGSKTRPSIFDTQEEGPVPGGSRFESDEHHRFEGSLIRLTAKTSTNVPVNPVIVTSEYAAERRILHDNTAPPPAFVTSLQKVHSLDAVKAMQEIINERKLSMKQNQPTHRTEAPYTYPTRVTWPIEYPPPVKLIAPADARRKLHPGILEDDDAQDAEQRAKWYKHLTTPVEITYLTLPRRGPLQPQRKRPTLPPEDPIAEPSTMSLDADSERQESLKKALETLRIVPESRKDDETSSDSDKAKAKDYISEETTNDNIKDYEEDDLKGLPVRRKRSISQTIETIHLKNHNPINIIDKALYSEDSLFGKFMSILRNGRVREHIEANKSEIADKNGSILAKSTPSRVTQEKIESFTKIITSTTPSVILKILKSNLITR